MEFGDLLKPARKRYEIGKSDHVTLLVWPIKMRYKILKLRLKGVDVAKIQNKKDGKTEEDITVLGDEYDGNYEYMLEVLMNGIHQDDHSFLKNGKTFPLDRSAFETMAEQNEKLFRELVKAVEEYQQEMTLGETKGTK